MSTLAVEDKVVDQQAQEQLIKTHGAMVKRIAHHLLGRLPPVVQCDDLIQAGMLGLLEADRHYDVTKGAAFETYATIRIRGYMLDEVRRNNWVPRSVYRNSRMLSEAVKNVENRYGREAKDHEIAKELHLNLSDYFELVNESLNSPLYGFDDLGITDDSISGDVEVYGDEPQSNVLQEDQAARLAEVMERLPKNERLVLLLYYKHDLNLKEIGDVLEVSESRVCQIHSEATNHMKNLLV